MVDAAEAAFPAEACGLIIGRGKGQLIRVTRVVPAENLLAETPDRFELDPATRIAVEKDLRDSGTKDRIIGHYHSHTDGTAEPSATDRAMAFEPEMAWLIVGVLDGQAIQTLGHRMDEKRGNFRPVPLRTPKAK
ncbi:M67 family metallopeptidase [Magnetospirillum sp. J10]|uniref:M67 family metallopeptidase n=2 Tax=Magnetospirillum sulfuroxidans TaxID=611300 RepID=A0ABS5ICM7_9PROT|nr:M67 family metallopeptidase [Magnetospirillum sulfuroxidans]